MGHTVQPLRWGVQSCRSPEIVARYDELLTDEGYAVIGTFAEPPDHPQGIAAAQPDLIIMDWFFGKEAVGMQTLAMLTTYPPPAPIPVIVCTAAGKALDLVEGLQTHCGVRIRHKPFAIDDLLTMIPQVFARP